MRHQVKGKKLNRGASERKSLYKNLINSVILHEKIHTTEVKAKAVKPALEKLITLAKKQTPVSMRRLQGELPTKLAQDKLFGELAKRYENRPGGYSRIIRLGPRESDLTKMAILELLQADGEKVKK